MSSKVLAVVGLPGSGKSEATKACLDSGLFAENVYFGGIVLDEVARRGFPLTQEYERPVREELRKTHGMGAIAKLAMPRIKEAYKKGNVLLESFYSTEEYEILKSEFGDNFKVLALYAPQSLRARRMANRPVRPLTLKELIERDMSQIKDAHQAGPIALADYMILNVGSPEDLKNEVLKALRILIQ